MDKNVKVTLRNILTQCESALKATVPAEFGLDF